MLGGDRNPGTALSIPDCAWPHSAVSAAEHVRPSAIRATSAECGGNYPGLARLVQAGLGAIGGLLRCTIKATIEFGRVRLYILGESLVVRRRDTAHVHPNPSCGT